MRLELACCRRRLAMERRWLRFALRGVGRRWHSYVVAVVGRQWSGAVASMGFTFIQFSSVRWASLSADLDLYGISSVQHSAVQLSSVQFTLLRGQFSSVQFSSVQFRHRAPRYGYGPCRLNARAWEFGPGEEERAATNRLRFGSRFGRRARVRGRPTSPSGRSSGFAGGFFQFIISTAVSVRARWKKGQGAAEGKLLSQLSFPVYAGQVVFRAAHQQTPTWSLATGRRFLVSRFRQTCHVLSCSVWDLFAFCVIAA